MMISHHFGVPEEICRSVGETLRTMKFRLRTTMGDLEEFYSHSVATPIHGDRKSTRLNSSHLDLSRMPSSA